MEDAHVWASLIYIHISPLTVAVSSMQMVASRPEILEPSIVTSVLQILIVILVTMGFLLKGNVPIGTTLFLMKKPDDTVFHEVPQIEENVTHLPHLCRVNPLMIHHLGGDSMFLFRSRATHEEHLEQINAEIPLKGDYFVIHYFHNTANITVLFILAFIGVLPTHDSGLASFLSRNPPLSRMTVNGFTYLPPNANIMFLLLIVI